MKLDGKIALITGAGKGIGAAIARGFAEEGATVLVNDIPEATYTDEVVQSIRRDGRQAEAVYADLSQVSEIRRIFAAISEKYGRLDILVNNAGITGWNDFYETEEAIFDRVVQLNLKGTLFCTIEAAKIMRETGGGSIINISSVVTALSVKNLICYVATKGGIEAMTRQMAVELAPHRIRVNCFGPGPINTERNLTEDPNYRENWGSVIPMQRSGEPGEMVGPALFLASDDSSFVTGQMFYADGGWGVQGKISEASMNSQLTNTKDR